MFRVKRKDNFNIVREVFDTRETEDGELEFLTYGLTIDSWYWIPADEYVPIDTE